MAGKLGLSSLVIDERTIPLRCILKTKIEELSTPNKMDIDEHIGAMFIEDMFGNDKWGCCAISARANQTRRFEMYEQKKYIPITTKDVLEEYWNEGSKSFWGRILYRIFGIKPDNGLSMLGTMKDWRSEGWKVAGNNYTIYAFARVNQYDHMEVKQAITYLGGLQVGMKVTQSSVDQFDEGKKWIRVNNEGKFLGRHAIYVVGYDDEGLTCITWGKRQKMSWEWWDKNVDEVYAVVDNRNKWQDDSPIDVQKLNEYLNIITSD